MGKARKGKKKPRLEKRKGFTPGTVTVNPGAYLFRSGEYDDWGVGYQFLPDHPRRILLIPDTHSPFHDTKAWAAMMAFARSWKPDTLVHLGDMGDFYSVSDHDKNPKRAFNLLDECEVTNKLFDDLDSLGAKRKVFCRGNHEYRLDRYLMRSAPALIGVTSVDRLFNLKERGWTDVPYMQHHRIGNLYVTHEAGVAGSNAVRKMAQMVGHNIAFGHTHRLECMYFGTIVGERYISASLGWLGDIASADYKSEIEKAAWQLGFGRVDMEPNGDFRLTPVPIVAGRVVGGV